MPSRADDAENTSSSALLASASWQEGELTAELRPPFDVLAGGESNSEFKHELQAENAGV